MDFLQNRKGQTLATPYSVRPTPKANVSTPLHWDEVDVKLFPEMFNLSNIEKRLDEVYYVWDGFFDDNITMSDALEKVPNF